MVHARILSLLQTHRLVQNLVTSLSCVVCLLSLVRMHMHAAAVDFMRIIGIFTSLFTVIAGCGAEFTLVGMIYINNFLQYRIILILCVT